jgi:hypothetical protein
MAHYYHEASENENVKAKIRRIQTDFEFHTKCYRISQISKVNMRIKEGKGGSGIE